ncbi:MAG: exodeoxyribonuclease VII large subunit [Deltaproteobacteria bacterium]|nr:exodeoxyribonuclease VII large subunit [Deltaproteobacteria bacterium]
MVEGRRIFEVSELAAGIQELLEQEIGRVWVVGEISDFFRARSGHCYFVLKDGGAQLRAVLFRGNLARIPFDPEDGLEVVAQAEIGFYRPRGDVQLIVRSLEPRGQGALQLAFEQLRSRLEAEGLFADTLKRVLPTWPTRIAVVTSPAGAALHDVLQVTGRRAPGIPLVVAPTRVQGEGADLEIEAALAAAARLPDVDLVLLVRGGGSLEDLMAFNTERVARAIRACPLPVVSGVGHEVDVTIADLAADARAPTPSAAAELAVPDTWPWVQRLDREADRLAHAMAAVVDRQRLALAGLAETLQTHAPRTRLAAQRERLRANQHALNAAWLRAQDGWRGRLHENRGRLGRQAVALVPDRTERVVGLRARLDRATRVATAEHAGQLRELAGRLHALSPLAVLSRGFSIVRKAEDGTILRRAQDTAPGERLRVQLEEGALEAEVLSSGDQAGPTR